LKGVNDVSLDFDNALVTLKVSGKTGLKPSDIKKALPKRFKATSIAAEELTGEASKDGDAVKFKAAGSGLEFEAAKAKDAKAYDELVAKLGEGKTSFKLAGNLVEEKTKKEDKEVTVLRIEVTAVSLVESK
jgi:hypothetical protein